MNLRRDLIHKADNNFLPCSKALRLGYYLYTCGGAVAKGYCFATKEDSERIKEADDADVI